MDTAIDFYNKEYLTEVFRASTGGGTITFALRIHLRSNAHSEYVLTGSYDPRTLAPMQDKIVARAVDFAGKMPYAATIGGVQYQLAPYYPVT